MPDMPMSPRPSGAVAGPVDPSLRVIMSTIVLLMAGDLKQRSVVGSHRTGVDA